MDCLGGSDGLAGSSGVLERLGGRVWLGTNSLLLLIAFRVALFSSGALLGGSGGSFDGSYAGARTWYMVPLPLLVPVLLEPRERVEMPEAIVEIDSVDSRRFKLRLSEGLRGGSVGVCLGVPLLVVLFRGGGRGGSAGEIFGLSTAVGWFPSCLALVGALLRIGGLLTVCCRWYAGGRWLGGGGGGFFFVVVATS
jgi:hypothetical protein